MDAPKMDACTVGALAPCKEDGGLVATGPIQLTADARDCCEIVPAVCDQQPQEDTGSPRGALSAGLSSRRTSTDKSERTVSFDLPPPPCRPAHAWRPDKPRVGEGPRMAPEKDEYTIYVAGELKKDKKTVKGCLPTTAEILAVELPPPRPMRPAWAPPSVSVSNVTEELDLDNEPDASAAEASAAPGAARRSAAAALERAAAACKAWGARVAAPWKRGPRHPAATRAAPPAAAAAAPAPPGQAAAEEAAGVYPLQAAMAAMAMSIGQPARVPTEDLLGSRELADARELVRQRAAHVAAWVASGMHGEDAQVYWELHCIGLRCGKSDADGRLPRDALLRNPVADALDDGWWHGCLGRPLGVQC